MPSKFDVPTEDSQALIKWGETKHEEGRRQRPDFMPRLALAFYNGHHFIVFDPRDRRLRRQRNNRNDPNAPVRVSAPIIGDLVDRTIAKLTKDLPVPETRPVSDDPDDRSTAQVGTRLLASEWYRLQMNSVLPELYQWVVPVGYAFLQLTWSAQSGEVVGRDPETGSTVHKGEIVQDIVPHFEMTIDPNASDVRKARWAIRTISMTREEVWERYGKEVGDAPAARTLSDELLQMESFSEEGGKLPDKVAVRQLWIRPKAMRSVPEGLVATWAGGTMLSEPKPFPYDHKRLPFIQFNFQPPQGSPFGRSPVKDLIPLQMDYNDAKSRLATIRRQIVPKFLYPEGAVNPDMVTTRSEQIPYKEAFGGKPEWLMPNARWQEQYFNTMARTEEEMRARMGLTEAATGQLAGTSAAATAIQQAELSREPLSVPELELAKGLREVGWQILMLARQYWREKRVVRTWSRSGNLEVRRFNKADIQDNLDVHVTMESALPRSKSGRAQLFIELWQQGLLRDPRMFVKMLNLPPTDILSAEFNRQVKKQERELGQMIDNPDEVAQVNPLSDEHETHIKVIVDYMQLPEYEDLSDEQKAALQDHLFGHLSLAGAQQEGAQAQGQEPGAGGDPRTMNQGSGPAGAAGAVGQGQVPVPATTAIARLGGRTGEPGNVPGVTPDDLAAELGR